MHLGYFIQILWDYGPNNPDTWKRHVHFVWSLLVKFRFKWPKGWVQLSKFKEIDGFSHLYLECKELATLAMSVFCNPIKV